VIRGCLWEPNAFLGTLEISWGVSGHLENGVGLNNPYNWDLCKMQLKSESKDIATLGGHHWV